LAVAVPTSILFVYAVVRETGLEIPGPVAEAVQGVSGEPVYVVAAEGQLTETVEPALPIVREVVALLGRKSVVVPLYAASTE